MVIISHNLQHNEGYIFSDLSEVIFSYSQDWENQLTVSRKELLLWEDQIIPTNQPLYLYFERNQQFSHSFGRFDCFLKNKFWIWYQNNQLKLKIFDERVKIICQYNSFYQSFGLGFHSHNPSYKQISIQNGINLQSFLSPFVKDENPIFQLYFVNEGGKLFLGDFSINNFVPSISVIDVIPKLSYNQEVCRLCSYCHDESLPSEYQCIKWDFNKKPKLFTVQNQQIRTK